MFFDPLGLICPILLQPKLLFRNIVIQKYQWNTKVNIDINNKWKSYLTDLKTIKQGSVIPELQNLVTKPSYVL